MDADAGKCPVQKQKNTSQNVLVAKAWGNFPQNKVVPSFRKRLREYLKAGRKCFNRLLYFKNVFTFTVFALVLNAVIQL